MTGNRCWEKSMGNMKNNMKRLFLLLFALCFTLNAVGQVALNPSLTRSGVRLFWDGNRLTNEDAAGLLLDVGGIDYSKDWQEIQRWRPFFNELMVGGGVLATAGFALVTALVAHNGSGVFIYQPYWPVAWGALLVGSAGLGAMMTGIHLRNKQHARLDGIINSFNDNCASRQSTACLSVGLTTHGAGMMLYF